MNKTLNIVELIEKNPITRLSAKVCTTRLLSKIRDNFTEDQQHLFLASFYCYLNYDSKKDFVVSLDDIWKWTGFARKDFAKKLLEKNFIINIDYIVRKPASPAGEANNFDDEHDVSEETENVPAIEGGKRGGLNKEIISLTVSAFKKFCLKANTKRADEIHNYYIRLEELMQETIIEENDEIRKQLQAKDNELSKRDEKISELSRYVVKRLNNKFRPGNCVYFVRSPEITGSFKIGSTSNINVRLQDFNTASPQEMEVIELFFTEFHCLLERSIKELFSKHRLSVNNEWYKSSALEEIRGYIQKQIELYNAYKTHSDIGMMGEMRPPPEAIDSGEEEIPPVAIYADEKVCAECNKLLKHRCFFLIDRAKREYHDRCIPCYDRAHGGLAHKQCTKCDRIKEKKQGFVIDKTKKDGFAYDCKECRNEINEQYREQHRNDNRVQCVACQEFLTRNRFFKTGDPERPHHDRCVSCWEGGTDKKQCSECLAIKTRDVDFMRNRSTKDGFSYDCRECKKVKRDAVRSEIREKHKNINKKQCAACHEYLLFNMFFRTGDDAEPYYDQCMRCHTPASLQCNKCLQVKTTSCFSYDKSKRTGYRTICKACT